MPDASTTSESGRIRVGAVAYLNSQPLTWCLSELAPHLEIVEDLPSRLAEGLARGRLDVALVPSIERLRHADYAIVSDACVACQGPVRSIKLYGRVPVERIRTLALDEGSRTSVALARILLRERFGLEPALEELAIGKSLADTAADAVLLIGDRAMLPVDGAFQFVWDLGEEWFRWTGLPFVFAVWTARAGANLPGVDALLSAARDQGVGCLEEIACKQAPLLGLPESECLSYLRENLRFRLGAREREGLERFYRLVEKHGLAEKGTAAFVAPHFGGRGAMRVCSEGSPPPLAGEGSGVRGIGGFRPIERPLTPNSSPASGRGELLEQRLAEQCLRASGPFFPALDRAVAGQRLSPEEAISLLESHDLAALARAADAVARRLHPEPYRTYHIDRNINYTNVCTSGCRFCAFSRRPGDAEGYVISREDLYQKIDETIRLGGDQILLQGGLHPELPLEWYESLLSDVKERFPQINVHGFSPPEIAHLSRLSGLSVTAVLERLKRAGLGSLPGGGAEILVDRVRQAVSPCKVSADGWLDVCRRWHELGGRGSATMMFGHLETPAERIEHLARLRQLQDETGGFTAFICWTFQPGRTDLANLPRAGAFAYLKTLAISRLFLDNFVNIQASWVTQGMKIGQAALRFGANDLGSLMIEENVVAAAGTRFRTTEEELRRAIREAGYIPRRRNVFYQLREEPSA